MSKGAVLLALVSSGTCVGTVVAPGDRPQTGWPAHARVADAEALHAFFESLLEAAGHPELVGVAIATEGQVSNTAAVCEGTDLVIEAESIRARLDAPRVRLMTAKMACALGVPRLGAKDRTVICEGTAQLDRPIAVVGTEASLAPIYALPAPNGGWLAQESEGGRITVNTEGAREAAAAQLLWRGGRRSVGTILCRPGLLALYATLEQLDGCAAARPSAEVIFEDAAAGEARATETVQIFCSWLGSFSRQTAMMGATDGGVYLVGPLMRSLTSIFDYATFTERFRRPSAGDSYLSDVPVWVAISSAALFGLSTVFSPSDGRIEARNVLLLDC